MGRVLLTQATQDFLRPNFLFSVHLAGDSQAPRTHAGGCRACPLKMAPLLATRVAGELGGGTRHLTPGA